MSSDRKKILDRLLSQDTVVRDLFIKHSALEVDKIRPHLLQVQEQAQKVHNYRCIDHFRFLYPRSVTHPLYSVLKQRFPPSYILDIGACMGTDLRQMMVDGATKGMIFGLESEQSFVDLGFELFGDRDRLGESFVTGNIFDPRIISELLELTTTGKKKQFRQEEGFDIIHSGSVLHLLDYSKTRLLLRRIHTLLKCDGVFFGRTTGMSQPRLSESRYLHSPESLKSLMLELGFSKVKIRVMERTARSKNDPSVDHLVLAVQGSKTNTQPTLPTMNKKS